MPETKTTDSDLTCDQLNRGMKLYQRRKGHRAAMDDTILAWAALKYGHSNPRRALDLGKVKVPCPFMLHGTAAELCRMKPRDEFNSR